MAKQEEKQIQIQFKMMDLEQRQFALLTNADEWPEGELQIQNSLNFNCDTENRVLKVIAHFEFKKNDITQLLLTVQSVFEFSRDSWSAMYNLNEDAWILPAGLVQHLADITIGASRGILSVRTQEAGLNRIVLPLIHPANIINSNLRLPRNPQQQGQGEMPQGPSLGDA